MMQSNPSGTYIRIDQHTIWQSGVFCFLFPCFFHYSAIRCWTDWAASHWESIHFPWELYVLDWLDNDCLHVDKEMLAAAQVLGKLSFRILSTASCDICLAVESYIYALLCEGNADICSETTQLWFVIASTSLVCQCMFAIVSCSQSDSTAQLLFFLSMDTVRQSRTLSGSIKGGCFHFVCWK